MASNVLKYALIGGGAYLLWQSGALAKIMASFSGAPAPTTPPPGGGGGSTTTGGGGTTGAPPSTPPTYQYTPPTTRAALLAAIAHDNNVFYAQQGNKFNADQWKYYYEQLSGNAGKLDAAGYETLFFPSGRPADVKDYPLFDVDAFLSAIATKGLSGLAAIMPTPVAALVQRAASGDLVAAVHLTRMGVRIPVGGRQMTPADLLRGASRAGMRGIHLGGLPVSALKV
jgi:hypothetical protein